jgi:ATP adenylyltransferase/5',5'''-P-1,P-4-tetraphosphate phosphorylase II
LYSQPHRHFQAVFFDSSLAIPFVNLIETQSLPFKSFIFKLQHPNSDDLYAFYQSFIETHHGSSYNFIMSQNWLLLVPRKLPDTPSSMPSINALGCLGMILVKTHQELEAYLSDSNLLRFIYTDTFYPQVT